MSRGKLVAKPLHGPRALHGEAAELPAQAPFATIAAMAG